MLRDGHSQHREEDLEEASVGLDPGWALAETQLLISPKWIEMVQVG